MTGHALDDAVLAGLAGAGGGAVAVAALAALDGAVAAFDRAVAVVVVIAVIGAAAIAFDAALDCRVGAKGGAASAVLKCVFCTNFPVAAACGTGTRVSGGDRLITSLAALHRAVATGDRAILIVVIRAAVWAAAIGALALVDRRICTLGVACARVEEGVLCAGSVVIAVAACGTGAGLAVGDGLVAFLLAVFDTVATARRAVIIALRVASRGAAAVTVFARGDGVVGALGSAGGGVEEGIFGA